MGITGQASSPDPDGTPANQTRSAIAFPHPDTPERTVRELDLASLEVRRPLLGKGLGPFFGVLGSQHLLTQSLLEHEAAL